MYWTEERGLAGSREAFGMESEGALPARLNESCSGEETTWVSGSSNKVLARTMAANEPAIASLGKEGGTRKRATRSRAIIHNGR